MNQSKKLIERVLSKTRIYLAIIAILLIVLCIYDVRFILPSILVFILLLIYAYWANNKREEEITEHIKNLTFNLDKVAKIALVNLPFPLVIAETNGNLIFRNTKFNEEFANIDINNYLKEILSNIKTEIKNSDKKEKIVDEIRIDKKTYRIYGECVALREEYVITIYFIDNTKLVGLEKTLDDKDSFIGMIMIDNYDEMMQRISEDEKPQVIARIEKMIYNWGTAFDGLVLKSDRNSFVGIFDKRNVKKIKERKFDILDRIKEENYFDKMQFTLSIAMSNEGDNNYEKYKTAGAALDIVLGRGGDQAIVRENGKYHFFGGRTQEVERRTKVKARMIATSLENLMLEAKNIMVMGHANADIDCLGSAIGIYKLASELGKDVSIVNETCGISLNSFLISMKEQEEYKNAIIGREKALETIDDETLLIIVDTHKKNYVEVPELLEKTKNIVVIDHHRRSTDYIENAILTFQEVYASSAAELVTEILEYAETDIELSEFEAEALYAGIMMDTKAFTFKTGVRTFEAAAYLRKSGVDIIKVKKWFQSDLKTYNKISGIVRNAEIIYDSIAISVYEEDDEDANIVCAKAADELLTINNVTASFVLGKLDEKVCISGRSIGDINVQIILEKLGGGGHITLAGAQVEGMTTLEVKQELINRINEYFSEVG